jgi:hypothetical protein
MQTNHLILLFFAFAMPFGKASAQEAPEYVIKTEKILLKPAYQNHETSPPTWGTETEQIMICPAAPEGSTFKTVRTEVKIKDPFLAIEVTPAEWDESPRTIVTQTACKGGAQTVENYTKYTLISPSRIRETKSNGDYKIIERKILLTRGTGVMQPAEYLTIEKQVVTAPPAWKTTTVPAEHKVFEIRLCK